MNTIPAILNNYYVFYMDINQSEVVPCICLENRNCQSSLMLKSESQSNCGDSTNTQDQIREQPMLQQISDEFKVEQQLYSTKDTKVLLLQDKETQEFLVAKLTDIPENNSSASIHLAYQTQFYYKLGLSNVSHLSHIKNISVHKNYCIRLMQYACRGNISSLITNNLCFSKEQKFQHLKTVKNIIWQVVKGLQEIHNLGYAYRDLKPDNILVNHEGNILLTDFGLVSPFGEIDQSICGTPEFIAPQRISKVRKTLPINSAIDFWSLGILTFQLLMGYTPYCYQEGDMNSLLESMYGSYATFDQDYPFYCKQFVYGLLHTNPNKRLTLQKIKEHVFFKDVIQQPILSLECNCKCSSRS